MIRSADRNQPPFWKIKSLHQMTETEWESLCARCGICCLNRFKDAKTGKVHYTRIACRFLDLEACTCRVYGKPFFSVPECEKMTPETIVKLKWLPFTCGYRCVAEGRELAWWHPLISGDPNTVHRAGVSVRDKVISEVSIPLGELERFIIKQPHTPP